MKKGICALCGLEKELTFEHIPPRGAFNNLPAKPVSLGTIIKKNKLSKEVNKFWDFEGLKYKNLQKGTGEYSLCSNCNNCTGSWYGEDYVKFVRTIDDCFQRYKDCDNCTIEFMEVYPLRIIKQIVSMFCSLSPDNDELQELREFVLEKNKTGIDKQKFKICMYLTKSTRYRKTGDMIVLKQGGASIYSVKVSELVSYPIGLRLYYNPNDKLEYEGEDITCFADYEYTHSCRLFLPVKIYEVESAIPDI